MALLMNRTAYTLSTSIGLIQT